MGGGCGGNGRYGSRLGNKRYGRVRVVGGGMRCYGVMMGIGGEYGGFKGWGGGDRRGGDRRGGGWGRDRSGSVRICRGPSESVASQQTSAD